MTKSLEANFSLGATGATLSVFNVSGKFAAPGFVLAQVPAPVTECDAKAHNVGLIKPRTDLSNGYEGVAAEFLAGRGRAPASAIGTRAVRYWARRLSPGVA
jgi:hypothetical protein